jgi:hypothetical protein
MMVGGIAATPIIAQLFMSQGYEYCKSWEGGLFVRSELVFTYIAGIGKFIRSSCIYWAKIFLFERFIFLIGSMNLSKPTLK